MAPSRHQLRTTRDPPRPSVGAMVYRSDLVDHFRWLAGSQCFDEVVDEALVAIALVAYGHRTDLIQNGAWMTAGGVVERFGLDRFVARLRDERLI
jgi:hypothetical protein